MSFAPSTDLDPNNLDRDCREMGSSGMPHPLCLFVGHHCIGPHVTEATTSESLPHMARRSLRGSRDMQHNTCSFEASVGSFSIGQELFWV
jgi:hypothetical protein